MRFRPCIDIHNGKVKQIVGSSLRDEDDSAKENFVSEKDAGYYARLYKKYGLSGGHVIILNKAGSEYYEASRQQALAALSDFPQHLMIGGGINADNAAGYIEAGASHVIVTSFVFDADGINMDNLLALNEAVGSKHTVLDLSCRFTDGKYHVAANDKDKQKKIARWQKISEEVITYNFLDRLAQYCDEFLVHAVDAEGKAAGIDERLIEILAEAEHPVCYAGGISSYDDIKKLGQLGQGSRTALPIFGKFIARVLSGILRKNTTVFLTTSIAISRQPWK